MKIFDLKTIKDDWKNNKLLYFMVLPVLAYYLIFCYLPMGGILIGFKDYVPVLGKSFFSNLINSKWVGLKNFYDFFTGIYFKRIMFNTLKISFLSIICGFPAPIILALLLNEVKKNWYKRTIQTVTYLPHFISLVVICGMIKTFTNENGVISFLYGLLTNSKPETMLINPKMFVPIYIISDIWQQVGWGSIIYLAALSAVSTELYEAAIIDGAGRWKQTIHVTIPAIVPTISIMLILRLGSVLNVGYEKLILLYNDVTRPVGEVISTYVYQNGLIDRNYSFSTAVGLFNSVINVVFLVSANSISKKVSDTSLW